jgi:hypothetical protein
MAMPRMLLIMSSSISVVPTVCELLM